jgi:hypothetical protein
MNTKCLTLALMLSCALFASAQTSVRSLNPIAAPLPAEHDIALLAMGNITSASLGEFNNAAVIRQSNRNSAGVGAGYEIWKRGNGFVAEYSFTPTDSKLFNLTPAFKDTKAGQWPLDRNKVDFMYEHRFRARHTFQPYLGGGAFIVLLWGGNAPAHSNVNATGFDAWGGEVTTAGITTHLTSELSLKTGLLVDIGKASTYGDTTYQASQNLMFEPQLGLVWRIGR